MLVDNSIVVLESIFRRRQGGLAPAAAAVAGTAEVGGAVVAATLTTVAVFLPIVFVEGIAGQIFGDMAMTVTLSLLASLLVAVTIIPMLTAVGRRSSRAMAGGEAAHASAADAPDEDAAADPRAPTPLTLGRFSAGYDRFLRGALSRRAGTLGVAAVVFAAALLAVPAIDTELIPAISEGEFFFEVDLPEGTPLAATDRMVQRMEALVAAEPEVAHQYSTIGSRLVSGGMSLNTRAEHLGQLNVVLRDRGDEAAEARLGERLRRRFAALPDLTAKLGKPTYFSLKTPVELILYGENLATLDAYAGLLERRLREIPGLVDLRSSLEEGSPELRVVFDRARLAALGLDMRALSETLRDRLQGVVPTRFKEEDRQIDVRVRNREQDRATLADLRNMVVPGPEGQPLRLLTLADVQVDRGPAEIHRIQQQRGALVSANLQGRSLGSVVAEIRRLLAAQPPPPGVTAELGGQNQEMQVSFASLRFALALAVFLVYLVMAATFESLIHPFIVLFSIPLAIVGVVGGLLLTGTPISVIVLIGVVMLVGIVVNNAIVLIAKINQLRRAGLEKRLAVIRACHVRLRPILMTTLTTVLGLLPMTLAIGEGAELRTPLAITVSCGLVVSTLLTLGVIPALYLLVPSGVRTRAEEIAELEGAGGERA
jgi:HAE1 family hydrophobic/amphiphilic exporter-1